jgi:hypothetical protein
MIFNDFIVFGVLPFLLIFVIVFAILQKSKVLGEGKSQIDALVSLTIALLLVAVPGPKKVIIVNLMPWLAVGLAVLLTFFILYGFFAGDMKELPNWMKITFTVLTFVFVASLVVFLTNIEDLVAGVFQSGGDYLVNIFIFILIVGSIAWVVTSSKEK